MRTEEFGNTRCKSGQKYLSQFVIKKLKNEENVQNLVSGIEGRS